MPPREQIANFGAGPAGLPTEVLQTAASALLNFGDSGMGIAEISHRSAAAARIIKQTKEDLATFLDIPDDYEILFMQGGGTAQFAATVLNVVGHWITDRPQQAVDIQQLKLDYVVTGSWSLKAYEEAARLLPSEHVNVAADARNMNEDGKFGGIPDANMWKLSQDAAMVYFCDNETVDGVEFPEFPSVLLPKQDGTCPVVVADMSSNILSRKIPFENYSIVFFGAQKNLGLTGVTVTIVKKTLLQRPPPSPDMMRSLGLPVGPIGLSYHAVAKSNSLYNTLSIFDVYVAGLVIKQLMATHGDKKISGQEALANQKADQIYAILDSYPTVYHVVPNKGARSRMNICFRVELSMDRAASEALFLAQASARGLEGLKGHRSVGGIRVSNYNSISAEQMDKLALFLKEFAVKNV